MGVAGVTAWRAVAELAQVKADDTVLVLGASGGVGSIIVSAAHALGATVAGQTGHESNADWIKQRGADRVIVADAARLAGAAADLHPTVAFDGVGGGFSPPGRRVKSSFPGCRAPGEFAWRLSRQRQQ